MKIGAGGLQSLLTHDNVMSRQMEPGRGKVGLEEPQMQNQNLAQKPVDAASLFKAVDRLNDAAKMFNYPLQFKVIKDQERKRKVQVLNTQTDETQELTPQQAVKFSQERETTAGKKLDGYA